MRIRAKVENADRPGELMEVEFEIPDDSPEATQLRASVLPGSYSVVPADSPDLPLYKRPADWGFLRPARER